jgi:hypothetical protein
VRISVIITSTALFIGGCSSSHRVATDKKSEIIHGTIVLSDSSEIYVREIHIGNDSTVVVDDQGNEMRRIPNSEIQTIHTTDHAIGALEGLGLGILGGVVVGYGYESMFNQGDANARTGVSILGAMAGGTIGIIVGVVKGHTERYEFTQDSMRTPIRSTGSSGGY